MASFGGARKRGRHDAANGNGRFAGSKRSKDTESGLGSKSKPCTKFFSTAGCPFGEGCHFLHFVPGGYNAVAQMTNMSNLAFSPPPSRAPMGPPIPDPHGPIPSLKTKMCTKFNTPEGCKFGDSCRFSHGNPMGAPPMGPRRMGPPMPPPAAGFGASATAKISVDASLAGAIIGKGGANTKHICRVTGAKLAIRENEGDENLKNIELEGTLDQISRASEMVQELIMNVRASAPMNVKGGKPFAAPAAAAARSGNNFKTKVCENFAKGTCTFGDRCHFAHGASELRKSAV